MLAGAVHEILVALLANDACVRLGAPGAVAGVTAVEGEEATLEPFALFAFTVNTYDVPLVRPVTAQVNVDPLGVVQDFEPTVEVTV